MVRTVNCSFASSGMILFFVPAWNVPTVTTVGTCGSISLLTNRLQRHHDFGRNHNRVLAGLRRRPASAISPNCYVNRVGASQHRSRMPRNLACRHGVCIVQCENVLWFWKLRLKPGAKQRTRSANRFLRGLTN